MFLSRALFSLCACAMLVAPCAGFAQTIEATPIPMAPPPNFSSMGFLVGTWSCSSKSSRRPAAYTSTSTYTASADGWWLNEITVTNPIPWYPYKVTTFDKITYDASTMRWIDVMYGDYGSYGFSTSRGWVGDTMVWHDPTFAATSDVTSQTDVTVTMRSATRMTSTSSFTESSGRTVSVLTICTKND